MAVVDDLNITPCNMNKLSNGNLYKNIVACIVRGRQVELELYQESNDKLNDWVSYVGELSSDQGVANQRHIAQYFEAKKKPELVAIDEFVKDELLIEYNQDIKSDNNNQSA